MNRKKESPISTLTSLGQSLWYDNIQRRLLENGGERLEKRVAKIKAIEQEM